jgi:hypothetical protein
MSRMDTLEFRPTSRNETFVPSGDQRGMRPRRFRPPSLVSPELPGRTRNIRSWTSANAIHMPFGDQSGSMRLERHR